MQGPIGNTAQVGIHCYTSTDLYQWDDAGIVLPVADEDEHPESELVRGCIIERPKVIYNRETHTFVMWFHLEWKGNGYKTARSGVATACCPTGPFAFLHSLRPNGCMARDMTLFVDDDMTAYHIFTSEENATLHISQLTADYLRPSGTYVRVFEGQYTEAPAIVKCNGTYYFLGSGCTGWKPNPARSAMSTESVLGPWKETGNPCVGHTPDGMGPEVTFGGQSTFLLHVQGRAEDCIIAMFDQWHPENPIDGRYVWLPVQFDSKEQGKMVIQWQDEWDLSFWNNSTR